MHLNNPLIAIVLTMTLLTGCGGDTHLKVQGTTSITKGQELTDLQRALSEGAINQDDYERLRKKILKRDN